MDNNYKIAYIDEVPDDRESFVEEIKDGVTVVPIDPIPDIDAMIGYILSEHFDAIVVDYTLYASRPDIKYSGVELIKAFWEIRDNFPAFIMTNNRDTDNVDDKIRSSFVFEKRLINDEPKEIVRKLKKEIDFYKNETAALEEEFEILSLKKNETPEHFTDNDLERLKELDETIEKRINRDKRFGDIIKDSDSLKKLNTILDSAEEFLKSLKK